MDVSNARGHQTYPQGMVGEVPKFNKIMPSINE